ncbi:hypothetical protein H0H93_002666, partial [Arthromyces matolae]
PLFTYPPLEEKLQHPYSIPINAESSYVSLAKLISCVVTMALPMNKKEKTLLFATLTMTLPKFGACYRLTSLLHASWLVTHGKISNNERNRLFQNGLPGPLWNMIQQRLYIMKPSHSRNLPYDMEDIKAAAKYVLWNTDTASPPIAINIIGSMGTRALPEIAMPNMPGPSYGAAISVPVAKVEPKVEEIESRLDKKFTTALERLAEM